jgi:hypothetical protein
MSSDIDTAGSKTVGKGDKTEKVSFKFPEKMSTNDEISKSSLQGNQQGNCRRAFQKQRFQGKCDELKGRIYDCSDSRQADIYSKTTQEIGEYVDRTYRYGSDT